MGDDALGKLIDEQIEAITTCVNDVMAKQMKNRYGDDDFESFQRFANFCSTLVAVIDTVAENQKDAIRSLFDSCGDNRNTLSMITDALRSVHRKYDKSFLRTTIVGMLGLEEIEGAFLAHRDFMLELLKHADAAGKKLVELAENMDEAVDIAREFVDKEIEKLYDDTDCVRYALLKTFKDRKELKAFVDDTATALDSGIEVFIISPVELYLNLSKSSLTLVWKLLSFTKGMFKKDVGKDIEQMQAFLEGLVRTSRDTGALSMIKALKKCVPKKYAKRRMKEYDRILDIFKTRSDRETFLRRFETGVIFK